MNGSPFVFLIFSLSLFRLAWICLPYYCYYPMSCVHFPRKRRKKSFLIAYISMLVCGINLHFSITIIFLCRAWFFSIICTMLAFFFEGEPKTQRFEQIEIANKRELGRLTKWIEAKQEKKYHNNSIRLNEFRNGRKYGRWMDNGYDFLLR